MDSSETKKKVKIPRKIIIIAIIVILAAAIGILTFVLVKKKNGNSDSDQIAGMNGMMSIDGMVSATGTTTTGMISEELELDGLDTSLYVEEVYLHQGDTVEAGDKVLKISEDSLEEARNELERDAESAEYEYRSEVVTSAEDEIDAKATLDKADAQKEYASQTYEDTIRESQSKVDSLQDEIDDLNEKIAEYTDAVNNNYYYTYYDIEGKKEQLQYNFEYLNELYEDWNIEDLESGSSGSASSASSGSSDMAGGSGGDMAGGSGGMGSTGSASSTASSGSSDKLTAYNLFDAEVTEESEEYQEALDNYEEMTRLAASNLAESQAELEQKEAELAEAQADLEAVKISAQAAYDETVAQCELAQQTYDTEIKRIEDELDSAESTYEDAKESLEYFEEKLGDGYFYTSSAGDVMMIMARADDSLSGDSIVMAYTDADSLSVEVSVDQADIASISVGESAMVSISGYGNYEGTVIAIDPQSQSTSKSSVYYTVTVSLDGDISQLSENLTATVVFGMDETGKEVADTDEQSGEQAEE